MHPTGKRVLIIRKNGEYLVGVPYSDTTFLRWSTSPYDAYRMERRRIAKRIADRVGGEMPFIYKSIDKKDFSIVKNLFSTKQVSWSRLLCNL